MKRKICGFCDAISDKIIPVYKLKKCGCYSCTLCITFDVNEKNKVKYTCPCGEDVSSYMKRKNGDETSYFCVECDEFMEKWSFFKVCNRRMCFCCKDRKEYEAAIKIQRWYTKIYYRPDLYKNKLIEELDKFNCIC